MDLVKCAEPHRTEATGQVELSDTDRYPSLAEWEAIRDSRCTPLAAEHLGRPYDPEGRVILFFSVPLKESWNAGYRTMLCGLAARPDTTDAGVLTERLSHLDASIHYPVGICQIETTAGLLTGDCDTPHRYEVAGYAVFSGRARPSDADWNQIAGEICSPIVSSYTGRPIGFGASDVNLSVRPLSEIAWNAGARGFDCLAVQLGPDGSAIDVTGTLAAERSGTTTTDTIDDTSGRSDDTSTTGGPGRSLSTGPPVATGTS